MSGYDAALARAIDRHTAGPSWEGRPVELYRQEANWRGLGPCELTIDVEAGSTEGYVVEAVSDEGEELCIAHILAPDRWVMLSPDECRAAELMASEMAADERAEAAECRAEMAGGW